MKKRIISMLLTLSMVFSMVPMLGIGVGAVNHESKNDDICFLMPYAYDAYLFSNTHYYITHHNINKTYNAAALEASFNNSMVTGILNSLKDAKWYEKTARIVCELSDAVFDGDGEKTSERDLYDSLLISMLLDNACALGQNKSYVANEFNKYKNFFDLFMTAKTTGMNLWDAISKYGISIIDTIIEGFAYSKDEAVTILVTDENNEVFEYVFEATDIDKTLSEIIGEKASDLSTEELTKKFKLVRKIIDYFIKADAHRRDVQEKLAYAEAIRESVSGEIVNLLKKMGIYALNADNDNLKPFYLELSDSIARYVELIESKDGEEAIQKFILDVVAQESDEFAFEVLCSLFSEMLEENVYYAGLKFIYQWANLLGNNTKEIDFIHVIGFIHNFNECVVKAMKSLEQECIDGISDSDSVDSCMSYNAGMIACWRLQLKELEYAKDYLEVFYGTDEYNDYFKNDQAWENEMNSIEGIREQIKGKIDKYISAALSIYETHMMYIAKGLTIKYDLHGGKGDIPDQVKPYNGTINLTNLIPQKEGYSFKNWEIKGQPYSSGEQLGKTVKETNEGLEPCWCSQEITAVAQWDDIDAITYIADSATNVPASHENKGVLSNQVPRKTGYDFLGWDEDPNVKNPTYKAGDPISKTGDVTLYAIWEKVVFNIIFDADGPDGDGGYFPTSNTTTITKTKPYGEAFVIDVEKPVRPGYIFADKWTHYNSKSGENEPFDHDPNKTIYDIGDETTIDKVLYPVWTDATVDVTYDFNNNGANQKETVEVDISVSSSHTILSPSDLTNIDETYFKGWMFPDPNGAYWWAGTTEYGNAYDNGKVSIIMPGQNISLTGDLDLYAKWDYFIHYNDGTSFTHDAVRDGNNYALKEPAVSSAKMFNGWMLMETGEILQPGDTLTLTSDITLNAIWDGEVVETPDNPDAPVTYSIMYDWGDWVDGVVQTKKYDVKYHDVDYVLSSEIPVYAEYIFKGWALATDLHTPVYQPGDIYTENADIVFYAVWEEPEIFSGPVTVSGYVVDYTKESENYGNPLSGVTVEFFDNETGESVGTAVTDSDGVYTFTFPAPGSYKKVLSKEGYYTFTVDTVIIVENTPSLGTSYLTQKRTIVAEGTCGDNLIWALDDEGLLTIDGSGEMDDYSLDTATPWASNKDKLKRIWLSEGITKIGSYAFYECASITGSLTIPDSVTEIGEWAFYKCTGLTGDLAIPDNVIKIGDHSFDRCYGFKGSLIISDGVTEIGEKAFYNCSGFSGNLTIPDGVTFIGDGAFYYCINFTGPLTLPTNITSIGNDVFSNCYSLTGSLEIPDSVSKIGEYAFFGCDFTGSLTIPDSVTEIGKRAFSSSGFTGTLTISKNITSIKDWTFGGSNFTGTLNIPNSVTWIGNNAFRACDFTGSLTIPDSVTEIGDGAFAYCDGLTGTLTIPESVTVIGDSAFRECTGLTGDLIIPDSVTSIGEYAFSKCSGFTGALTISNSVTTIQKYTFNGCEGFSGSLIIPNGVIEIGEYAFYACDGFSETLTISNTVTSIGSYAFSGCHNFTGTLVIPDSVTEIGEYAFWCCCNFKGTLTIPDSVTLIGNHAFYSCQGFSSLILPNSITSIEDWVFSSCNFLGALTIPNSITSIGNHAFSACNFTGTLIIPDSVTSIGSNAFVLCRGIDKAFFHGDVPETWGNCVFDDNAEGFLIYYQENTSGWTSPKWAAPDGSVYNTAVWSGFTADLNGDGATTEADALYLLRHTILPARYPLSTDAADFDGNGIVDAKDAAWLKQRIN